jgi:hypothetical protein
MLEEIWKELPHDILFFNILSKLDIDTRLKLKVPPCKINPTIIEYYENNCKFHNPIINYIKIDCLSHLEAIELYVIIPSGVYIIQYFMHDNYEEIYVVNKNQNDLIMQIFIMKYCTRQCSIIHRSHIFRS